jgi:hypothetical protein
MRLRLLSASLALALLAMFVITPLAGAAPKTAGGTATLTNTVGTVTTTLGAVTNLQAVFNAATGITTITGTLTTATGIVADFTTTLLGTSGSCEILNLVLGPLFIDVLGLQIDLNRVVLNITAQSGPGNLLGNLLCTVARLLDSSASGNAIANLLNRIFSLL